MQVSDKRWARFYHCSRAQRERPTSIAATGHWILPRLHRLWAAVRKPLVRSWRLSKQWAWSWGEGPRRSAADGSRISAIWAEQTCASKQTNMNIPFNCKNCFARNRLDKLQQAAVEHHFPMRLTGIATAQNGRTKGIRVNGACSVRRAAVSGITAGCGMPADLVQCSYASDIRRIHSQVVHPCLYVDVQVTGSPALVVDLNTGNTKTLSNHESV